jgi:hypothetical protein
MKDARGEQAQVVEVPDFFKKLETATPQKLSSALVAQIMQKLKKIKNEKRY